MAQPRRHRQEVADRDPPATALGPARHEPGDRVVHGELPVGDEQAGEQARDRLDARHGAGRRPVPRGIPLRDDLPSVSDQDGIGARRLGERQVFPIAPGSRPSAAGSADCQKPSPSGGAAAAARCDGAAQSQRLLQLAHLDEDRVIGGEPPADSSKDRSAAAASSCMPVRCAA